MMLSDLIAEAKKRVFLGNAEGVCIICQRPTTKGHKAKKILSNSFTAWNVFHDGDCICEKCSLLFEDQNLRRKSWVASRGGIEFFKNDEALEVLLNPPNPPFYIHIAKRGLKQTWLYNINRVAMNKSRYWFSHEGFDVPIYFDINKAREMLNVINDLISLGFTKTELILGQFKLVNYRKLIMEGKEDLAKVATKYLKSPLWEVMVDVYRRESYSRVFGAYIQNNSMEGD